MWFTFNNSILFILILTLRSSSFAFSETERGKERETLMWEKHWLIAFAGSQTQTGNLLGSGIVGGTHLPPDQGWTCNRGMCPDQESNRNSSIKGLGWWWGACFNHWATLARATTQRTLQITQLWCLKKNLIKYTNLRPQCTSHLWRIARILFKFRWLYVGTIFFFWWLQDFFWALSWLNDFFKVKKKKRRKG